MSQFKTIGILGRIDSSLAVDTLQHLREFLFSKGVKVLIEETSALGLVREESSTICEHEALCQESDLVIVVGGDGSLLSAGRLAAIYGKPLLGINRGKLGFLADINPGDLDSALTDILEGQFTIEDRFLLEASTGPAYNGLALNDVVINSGGAVHMLEFELYVDEQFVYSQSSDGLIISTPTGSTAYALSGGGPIMHPTLDAIVLVPMFPHTLSSRPIVIDGNSEISIVFKGNPDFRAEMSCDGQTNVMVKPGGEIRIGKSSNKLKLLHPLNHDFYEACRSKLGWGTKL